MNLYQIHDNARKTLDWEEVTWMTIWARDPAEAIRVYQNRYIQATEADQIPSVEEIVCRVVDPLPPEARVPEVPGPEHNARVHRRMGWRIECERTCDTCGLAAMDLPEYRVCGECGQCPECGHSDDCEEGDEDA